LKVLAEKKRIYNEGKSILFIYYLDDFPLIPLSNLWIDARGDMKMRYSVQTTAKIVERCLLMTSDVGDLVLDPTCGSGTTAFVAEKWARRWITCDISPMAINITRSRLLSAVFDYYQIKLDSSTQKPCFSYKKYPHISASTIAYHKEPDYEVMIDEPEMDSSMIRVAMTFQLETISAPKSQKPIKVKEISAKISKDRNCFIREILSLLTKNGIWYPNGKNISIVAIKPTTLNYFHAIGSVNLNGNIQKVGIYIGPKYESIEFNHVQNAIVEIKDAGLSSLLVIGYQFDIEVQNQIQKLNDSEIKCLMICINPDITLEDLESIPKDVQVFSVLGVPVVDVLKFNSQVQITLRGIEIYQYDTNSKEIISPEYLNLWSIDENYNQSQFRPQQCLFFSLNRAAHSVLRNWQTYFHEFNSDLMIGTESNPFVPPKSEKIAIKVIDAHGYESLKVIKM
jgi:adenine-specific DNA-methyltransferase